MKYRRINIEKLCFKPC